MKKTILILLTLAIGICLSVFITSANQEQLSTELIHVKSPTEAARVTDILTTNNINWTLENGIISVSSSAHKKATKIISIQE